MTYDGSDRKHVRKAEKSAAQADARRRNFIRQIMLSMDGREWMHNLLEKCHMWHTPFSAGQPDSTAFRCGESNVGLQIFGDVVNICPSEYVLMMQEANAREIIDDRRYSDSGPAVTAGPAGGSADSGRDAVGSTASAGGEDPEPGSEDGWVH